MKLNLSKTDYLLYRECPKNAWYKIHRPNIYSQSELPEFKKSIVETGNEVELVARKLFPTGILIERRDIKGQEATQKYLSKKHEILFQPIFVKDGCLAAIDVLKFDPKTKSYSIYEIKSTSGVDKKNHYHDVAFQVNLLRKCDLTINKAYIIHLNSEYVRSGELDIAQLFKVIDISNEVESVADSVATESAEALKYLSRDSEPDGYCCCIYKGRSRHCSTFQHANPEVPEYSVHDIARIGNSKAKLKELIDNNIFHLDKIPAHIKLTGIQQSQVDRYVLNEVLIEKEKIVEELKTLTFPLYFLDYETFPAAIPRFNGFSPYHQIPFQYSIHILKSADSQLIHREFLCVAPDDPSKSFAGVLQKDIGESGSIIVWHKGFECGRNDEIATRLPETKVFVDSLKERIYDLEDIFRKQYCIHRDFRGGTSIKRVLSALVPELSYKELKIQGGGDAADTWNKIVTGSFTEAEKEKAINDLKTYCGLDTYAMYSIWCVFHKFLIK
ncbi:DUF2779 domain-containing protein [Patescibacteria group bacterium AH-259-L07]|nr:DUF2779 domain-containing protein [Patescibacteria group bacterium AH-259-L07]